MGAGLIERGKNQIQNKNNEQFLSVDDSKPIKPLFENIWDANLSTLSVILEKTNDTNTAALCVEGFAHSIKICGYFNMQDERDAFVASFAKFSQIGSEQRIKNKNILVIEKILELATF
jgi:brefeldin A-inhibited guanine nucleotide-exchange protein